jgi:hypothetical protein
MVTDWIQAIAVVAAGIWALMEVKRYRQTKIIIQLEVDAHLYRLSPPITAEPLTWEEGQEEPTILSSRLHPYALEVLLIFHNMGRTRFRLYNAMIAVNALTSSDRRPADQLFSVTDGHLRLARIMTSGNIVTSGDAAIKLASHPSSEQRFFYIEPGVRQAISYVVLLPEISGLLQVQGRFSLSKQRIFPARQRDESGLLPHKVVRTYQVIEGQLVGRD